MFKKVLSLLLTMVVITGIFGTAAFAAVPQVETDLDTDGETVKGHYYVDNFDQYPYDVTSLNQGYPGYNNYSGDADAADRVKVSSSVFGSNGGVGTNTQIDIDGGRDGKGALVLNGKSSNSDYLKFRTDYQSELTANHIAVAKYDVKFAELPAEIADRKLLLSGQSNNAGDILGINRTSGEDAYFYVRVPDVSITKVAKVDTNMWYTIVFETKVTAVSAEGAVSNCQRTVSVLDDSGNVVVTASSGSTLGTGYLSFTSVYVTSNAVNGAKIYIDNASLSVYDMTKYAPSLTNTPSIANKTVGIGQQTTRVSFDQPIKEATAVVKNLTDTTAADITCTVTATTDALWSYDITIPSGNMNIETAYQLDLSGFKNNGGTACADSVNFETQKATAADYSQSADFTTPGTLSARKFANYPFLYFGTGTNTAGSTTVTDGVVNITGYWDYTNGNRIRTTDTINTSNANVTYVMTYRMKIGSADGGAVPDVDIGLNYPTMTGTDAATNYMASAGRIAEFRTVTGEDEKTYYTIGNIAINSLTSPWSPDTWYNIIWTVNSTQQHFSLYDDSGALIFDRTRALSDMSAAKTPDYYMYLAQASKLEGAMLSFDDITLWKLDSTKEWSQPRFVSNTEAEAVAEDSADVSMTLTFDQPMITDAGQYRLLDEDGYIAGEITVIQEDFCKQKLELKNLGFSEDYTLDYTDVTNLLGQALYAKDDTECNSPIEFTTAAFSDDTYSLAIAGETTVSGLNAGDAVNFKLYSRDGGNAKLICGFYNTQGHLLGIETKDAENLESGKVTEQTVTLSKAYPNARKVIIFGWDSLSALKPLMETETAIAPIEEISVLMIGNSLTEDALRNLTNVAAAGNLTVNVTAKLCGGASLTDHAGNLVAEIEDGRTVEQAQDAITNNTTDKTLRYLYFNKGNNALSDKLISTALTGETKYDIVSIQPYGTADSEISAMQTIVNYVKEYQPQAEIVLYQPWSDYSKYKTTRDTYFEAIESHTQALIAAVGEMTVVPSGYAFYLACNQDEETYGAQYYESADSNTDAGEQATDAEKTEFLNSTGLWRDISHASYYGCYLTDAVWYEVLTGKRAPTTFTNTDTQMTAPTADSEAVQAEKLEFLSQMAHRAVVAYK